MKKKLICLLAAAACFCLAGCGEVLPPEKAADGSDWNEDWVTISDIMGVDTPEELTLRDNNDTLSAKGMFYASWSIGEESTYINTEEEKEREVTIYDAQLFLLLSGSASEEKAEEELQEWLSLTDDRYQIDSRETRTYNGQEFTVITYQITSSPYTRGASAFGRYGNYAISAEFSCQEAFEGDPLNYLTDFLEHCHYGA